MFNVTVISCTKNEFISDLVIISNKYGQMNTAYLLVLVIIYNESTSIDYM